MRRYKKKELLESVSTLIEANDSIVKSIKTNPDGVAEVLAMCQESAILIGNYIESLDEKYAYLVRILEGYCENIFQMSEAVPDETQCRKITKKIQKQLNQLRYGITYDLPDDRKEVVFLPYKASMWDSLESVWKAADADENCDAYVIPIPYFDKNPDGSFREMHYEGDQYPSYVPVTKYDEYNFEERRPDEIYIHNPYDECNFVTSVHPDFYAQNLKKITDKLVYIPYFVLVEISPDDQAAIDGMKHFIFLPGVIYADKVIVQSENMRQIYINEYMKAALENGLPKEHTDRKRLEEKFLGLGSPKFDKVLNTKKEDLEILGEWLRVIEKPDGSWKKIIFYNTSIGALLANNEKMLEKMKDVFEVFKENRDEVALLWRPHPLIENTLTSMRPQLWEQYKKIRDGYIQEGWGIYDDTADMDRAVVLSDAYYGDGSSVVQLYQKTGKPILIQNVCMLSNHKKKINIQIETGVVVDNVIYYTIPRYNKYYCTNLTNGKTQCVRNTIGRREEETDRFNHSTKIGDSIFFLSDENYRYAVWNIKTGEIQEAYLRVDMKNKIQYLGQYRQIIYMVGCNMDKLYMIREGEIKETEIKEGNISSMEGIFWYFDRETCLLWEIDVIKKVKAKIVSLTGRLSLKDDGNYSFVFNKDGKFIFVPNLTDKILVYSMQDDNIETITLPDSTICILGGRGALRYIEGGEDEVFLSSMFSSEIYAWNKQGLTEIGKMGVGMDDISFGELYKDIIQNNLMNELYLDLSVYINLQRTDF